jgi:hypothetical protein
MEQKVYRFINTDFDELVYNFQNQFRPVFIKSNYQNSTTVLVLEQYYIRIESNLSITIIFDKISKNSIEVSIIASGGKHGLFEISWGAERSAIKKITKFFESYNAIIQ